MKDIKKISPYVFPGLPDRMETYKQAGISRRKIKLSISPEHNILRFSIDFEREMQLRSGDVVDFVEIGDELFVCKSKTGWKIGRSRIGSNLRCKSIRFIRLLKNNYGIDKSLSVGIKKTRTQLYGNVLYKLILPCWVQNRHRKLTTKTIATAI